MAKNPADTIRSRQAAAAREAAAHDAPLLESASEILTRIGADITALAALGPDLITSYVAIHLAALEVDHGRAVGAVATARQAVNAALETPTDG